jgi:hypothetical protein
MSDPDLDSVIAFDGADELIRAWRAELTPDPP